MVSAVEGAIILGHPVELNGPAREENRKLDVDRLRDTGQVSPQVVRYSERPEPWKGIGDLSAEVWPEYNLHGQALNYYWDQLYDVFPQWQFVLYDPEDQTVLAEGHTIPVAWDGTDVGLGPGIDATIAAGFGLRAAGGQPTAVCALAAEIPPRHQGRHLSGVLLQGMAGLGRDAGLDHLIAPVRPSHKAADPLPGSGHQEAACRPGRWLG